MLGCERSILLLEKWDRIRTVRQLGGCSRACGHLSLFRDMMDQERRQRGADHDQNGLDLLTQPLCSAALIHQRTTSTICSVRAGFDGAGRALKPLTDSTHA